MAENDPARRAPDAPLMLRTGRDLPHSVDAEQAVLGAVLSLWDPIERQLAGHAAMEEAVRARAVRAFHEQGLHRTSEGTGVLVFASLFERHFGKPE